MSSRMSFAAVAWLLAGCAAPPATPPSPPGGQGVPATQTAANDAAAPEGAASGDAAPPPAAFYTEPQARRGQRAFRQVCSDCHYTSEFKGPVFTDVWARRTARDLYRELRRTMPDDNPGGLPRQTYVDVMAYILELNGYPAGPDELPTDDEVLGGFRLTPPVGQGPGR